MAPAGSVLSCPSPPGHGAGPCPSLVQVLPCHSHVIGTLEGEHALEELQGQGQVGLHILDGVEGRAHAVRRHLVQVGRCLVLLLQGTKAQ